MVSLGNPISLSILLALASFFGNKTTFSYLFNDLSILTTEVFVFVKSVAFLINQITLTSLLSFSTNSTAPFFVSPPPSICVVFNFNGR